MGITVGAVIVAYNNCKGLKALLNSLYLQKYQLEEIIVVDNSTNDDTKIMIKESFDKVIYLKMPENIGSAGGYYEGIKYASAKNDYVWTLDDDLIIFPETLLRLVEGIEHLITIDKIGAVRCTFEAGIRNYFKMDGFAWRGTLINSAVIKEIGFPNKDYFMYNEDVEYSLRIKRAGYKMYYISDSRMEISRPNQTVYSVLGLKISFYDDPARLFYGIRNSTVTFIKYFLFLELFKLIGYIAKILICLIMLPIKDKNRYLSAIIQGFCNGISRKLGKDPRFLPRSGITKLAPEATN
ncbi:MAG: glycosyltransferase [Elusimicrobia bacterium]|nr:glycosyltransferase [Candidatus Liberimonas magnetica]